MSLDTAPEARGLTSGSQHARSAESPWTTLRAFLARRGLFVLVALTTFYFSPGGDPNQVSRYLLTEAIVLRGVPDITETHGATIDKGERSGRYYSDKAPGISLLAVPLYAAFRSAERLTGLDPAARPVARARVHVMAFVLAGLPLTFTALLLAGVLRRLGTRGDRADLLACGFALSTLAFPYATVLYGHTMAGLLLFGAFALVVAWETATSAASTDPLRSAGGDSERTQMPKRGLSFRASAGLGALAAGAFVVEYPTGLPAALVVLYTLTTSPAPSRISTLAGVALGAAGPVALHMAFATWAFGSPLALPYEFVIEPLFLAHTTSGLFGIGTPIPSAIYGALISPYRGLFFFCPLTALVFAGYGAWLATGRGVRLAALSSAITLAGLAFVVSYYAWDGGFSTGSRHLVPFCAFFVLPIGLLVERGGRWRLLSGALSIWGGLIMCVMLGVSMHVPEEDPFRGNPLYAVIVPSLLRGEVGIFFGDMFGSAPRGDTSATLAALFGAPSWVALIIPLVAWGLSLPFAIRAMRKAERAPAVSGAGEAAT